MSRGMAGQGAPAAVAAPPAAEAAPPAHRQLPVTVLSGFLGAGKSTLLKHILRNKQGLRCAVIVNDMAELNIDAALLKNASLVQAEERLVELSNGCICCTLRGDLLQEVQALAGEGRFDYLVIESTGIGEPMQVAETFTMPVAEGDAPLSDVARLDTCVTVVDAATLMANFASLQSLRERGEAAHEDDERTIPDLLLDQLEFADVVLLNKVDLVSEEEQLRLLGLLRTLNPGADVLPTQQGEVDLARVINTGRFSMEKAAQSAGWLKTLQEGAVVTPETEEYGIGSFVYRARRPFHPARLHALVTRHLLLQEPDWSEALAEEEAEHEHVHGPSCSHAAEEPQALGAAVSGTLGEAVLAASQATQQAAAALQALVDQQQQGTPASGGTGSQSLMLAAAAASAAAAAAASSTAALLVAQLTTVGSASSSSTALPIKPAQLAAAPQLVAAPTQPPISGYGQLLRSKGFVWLATRPDLCGEWSQAGGILRVGVGGPWYTTLPEEAWPTDPKARADILCDFQEPHGDRRQELVLIGIDLDRQGLTALLDACLCTDAEMAAAATAGGLPDPFVEWPPLEMILDGGEEDKGSEYSGSEEEESEHSHQEEQPSSAAGEEGEEDAAAAAGPQPGQVHSITEGASELQACLDALPPATQLAVVSFHAHWCDPCHTALRALRGLAAEHADTAAFFCLEVEGCSQANAFFALEKVMTRPQSKRRGSKPVLKGGHKFPCFTLHEPHSLQPVQTLYGAGAMEELAALLRIRAAKQVQLQQESSPAAPAAATAATVVTSATANGRGTDNRSRMQQLQQQSSSNPPAPAADVRELPLETAQGTGDAKGTLVQQQQPAAGASEVVTLKKGALQVKQVLSSTQGPVVVVWTQPDSEGAAELRAAAAEAAQHAAGVLVVDADVAAYKANGLLAQALRVKGSQEVHVYRSMKLESKLEGADATPAHLQQLLGRLSGSPSAAEGPATPSASGLAAPVPASNSAPKPSGAVSQQAAAGAAATATAEQPHSSSGGSMYDPPRGKFARPGATKRLPNGHTIHFFPKMPCLKCGCPWWSSDDWDARCIRCGWDCENGGYDNESQPVPKYRKKWEQYTAIIKEGRTPDYPAAAAAAKERAP